jgi:predicted RNA binding protein YcfA (HicA-like mRNA interferase family)
MKSSELLKILNREGWVTKRQTGSHLIMTHPTKEGTLIFPNHGSAEVGKGLATSWTKIVSCYLIFFIIIISL